ncbi:MAG TPA: hypothetical protein VMD52_06965 [Patescibacteria group bacterium]|nr:hypothetical protein [Patescibacteria group bacterium]
MAETLWQKWCAHYRNGGFFYALYRGVKYIVFLTRKYILRQ